MASNPDWKYVVIMAKRTEAKPYGTGFSKIHGGIGFRDLDIGKDQVWGVNGYNEVYRKKYTKDTWASGG